MAAIVRTLGELVMNHESIPWTAAALPLAGPPFDENTPFRITTEHPPDVCPEIVPGRVIHLHLTGGNIRSGICHVVHLRSAKLTERVAFIERCFKWAPTLKRMTAAARLAYALVSARWALDAVGAAASASQRLVERLYDIVDPRAIFEWEGVLMSELPESARELAELVGARETDEPRLEHVLGILDAAFGVGRDIYWSDMHDDHGLAELVILLGELDALGIAPPDAEPFLRFPLAAGHPGLEEGRHLRQLIAAAGERSYRGS
jgi:hypothetical protein